jgi:hypothetical protein
MTNNKKKVGCPKKYTPEYIEKIAKELEKWAKDDRSLFLSAFMGQHKEPLSNDHFFDWCKENILFRDTLAKVKQILVSRLHTKACYKELDGSYVAKIMPLVDLEYRAWRQQELKQEKEAEKKRVEVIVKNAK